MNRDSNELVSLKWIKLNRWCELTGDTPNAAHARRKTGKWENGVHCKVHDGKLWINVAEAQAWVDCGRKKLTEG